MSTPLSKGLLEWFQYPIEKEPELRNELNNVLNNKCKPCWELKYRPYEPLVEDFSFPPSTLKVHREHIEYLKGCLKIGKMGEKHDIPLNEERKKWFQASISDNDENHCVTKLSKFEKEASCKEFGHLCPAYFVSEFCTETSTRRKRSRNISHNTIIRVARRDNNICQVCGKILLDREIEIDHIIPYSRGGTSDENNLRVTCLDCNRKKGKKSSYRR